MTIDQTLSIDEYTLTSEQRARSDKEREKRSKWDDYDEETTGYGNESTTSWPRKLFRPEDATNLDFLVL